MKPSASSQLTLFANYSYQGFITDRQGDTLEPEAGHRRNGRVDCSIRNLKYGLGLDHLPAGRFPANPELAEAGLAGGARHAHNLVRWTRESAWNRSGDHQDPLSTIPLLGRVQHPQDPPTYPVPASALALGNPVCLSSGTTAGHSAV